MSRLLSTSHGTNPASYGPSEWLLAGAVALMWGSAAFFIAEGLDDLQPGMITSLRILVLGLSRLDRSPDLATVFSGFCPCSQNVMRRRQ